MVAGVAQMIPSINLSIMYVVYPEIQREFSDTSDRTYAASASRNVRGVSAVSPAVGNVRANRSR